MEYNGKEIKEKNVPQPEIQKTICSYSIEFIKNVHPIKMVEKDSSDNKFISGAPALEAKFIITKDKEFLKQCKEIDILTPYDFLKRFSY